MTIIRSRPEPLDELSIGAPAAFTLHLTDEELNLITALLCHCRLGQPTPYSKAAVELITKIEDAVGEDRTMDACDDVGMQATIEDGTGMIVLQTDSNHYITLEV